MKKVRITLNKKKKVEKIFPIQNSNQEPKIHNTIKKEIPSGSNTIIKDEKTNIEKSQNKEISVIPKIISKKLTVILLENTQNALNMKQDILKIINKLLTDDFICIINYSNQIKIEKICKVEDFKNEELLKEDLISDKAIFYNALTKLEDFVSTNYKSTQKYNDEIYKIDSIEIIGIGTGLDKGSIISKELATYYFNEIINVGNFESKYFCFTEDSVAEVAAIGFHSIGTFPSILKK